MLRPAPAATPIENANAEWVEVIADLSSDLANWRLQHLRGLWRPEVPPLERKLPDHVFEHRHTDTWLGRDSHGPVLLDGEGLADDLGLKVARRGRDVARQAEVWQRREVHVVRPADAHFEHAAAPH